MCIFVVSINHQMIISKLSINNRLLSRGQTRQAVMSLIDHRSMDLASLLIGVFFFAIC